MGLTDKAGAKPQTLSGGLRRRLDVALAVVGNPRLVFLDEPTTGFDPEARRKFWGLMEGLASDGTTVLLTTHYLDEAEYLADRIGIINNGRLIALDTPAKLRARASAAIVAWDEGGVRRLEETGAPTAVVQRLAAQFGGEVPGLTVTHPSLEDIYLSLIGEAADETASLAEEAAA